MATTDPERVSLLVVTDYDVGFVLTPLPPPPLPDVAPGESYVTECEPQRAVLVTEVLVEDFALVQISGGHGETKTVARAAIEQRAFGRLYHLDPALAAGPDAVVHLHLCNDTDVPRKPKTVTIVKGLR